MKKILLGSAAALVASAGVAAADVTLSGDGRIGVTYDSRSASHNRFAFTSRARVTFTLSGETDTGMAFGGSFRADNAGTNGTAGNGAVNGQAGSVFISGDFGRLTAGDTNGAAQQVTGHVAGVGLTGLGDLNESLFLGNNHGFQGVSRPTFRYDITIDGFTVAVSHTNPGVNNSVAAVGVGYAFDGITVGLGYEHLNRRNMSDIKHAIVGAGFSMDGISVRANYGRVSASANTAARDQYSLSASGSFDEVGVTAFYARDFGRASTVGVGGTYDLGGGASLRGGVVRSNVADGLTMRAASRYTRADFGINLSF